MVGKMLCIEVILMAALA